MVLEGIQHLPRFLHHQPLAVVWKEFFCFKSWNSNCSWSVVTLSGSKQGWGISSGSISQRWRSLSWLSWHLQPRTNRERKHSTCGNVHAYCSKSWSRCYLQCKNYVHLTIKTEKAPQETERCTKQLMHKSWLVRATLKKLSFLNSIINILDCKYPASFYWDNGG